MSRTKHINIITTVLIILTFFMSAAALFTIITHRESISQNTKNVIEEVVNERVSSIDIKDGKTPTLGVDYFNGQDGYTPIKGKDYTDGNDGKNGVDGYTPIKGVDYSDGKNGIDGANGKTPLLRCNETRNRWEVRYSTDERWQLLNGETVKCTVPTVLSILTP